jgi:hypothetical protein
MVEFWIAERMEMLLASTYPLPLTVIDSISESRWCPSHLRHCPNLDLTEVDNMQKSTTSGTQYASIRLELYQRNHLYQVHRIPIQVPEGKLSLSRCQSKPVRPFPSMMWVHYTVTRNMTLFLLFLIASVPINTSHLQQSSCPTDHPDSP